MNFCYRSRLWAFLIFLNTLSLSHMQGDVSYVDDVITEQRYQVSFLIRFLRTPPGEKVITFEDFSKACNDTWSEMGNLPSLENAVRNVEYSASQARQTEMMLFSFESSNKEDCLLVAEGFIREMLKRKDLTGLLRIIDEPVLRTITKKTVISKVTLRYED